MSCQDIRDKVCEFPLTVVAEDVAKRFELNVVLNDEGIVGRAIQLLRCALEREVDRVEAYRCALDEQAEVAAHRLAFLIAASLRNKVLENRFVVFEAKRLSFYAGRLPIDCKVELAKLLGLSLRNADEVVRYSEGRITPFQYAVSLTEYLKFRIGQDPNWALVNRPVVRGFVLLNHYEITRIMEEVFKSNLGRYAERIRADRELVEVVEELVKRREDLQKLLTSKLPRKRRGEVGGFPPCILNLIERLKEGENLSHAARFALASYLSNVGWDVERIVDLFRAAPDFDERKTRYQVMHISGLIGGRKKYLPPSCKLMATYDLCATNLACGVKNPIWYSTIKRDGRAAQVEKGG